MSGMDKNYITSVQLQSYFVDKTTGAPMSGGYVEFFKDSDRTDGKDVYQKVQNCFDTSVDPLYEYVSLGDVVQLSGVGTFMDNSNNDIAVYFYPWDADGNLELYYVVVYNADGTPQFTREGWPNSFATDNPDIGDSGGLENQISNPQFVEVNFDASATLTINLTGNTTTTVEVAPDWNLVVVHTATTTVEVERTAIAGSSNFPTQAPFYLTFTPGASISSMKLVQQLNNNPGIWSPEVTGVGGYVAANMVLGPNTPTTTITYTPSTGTSKLLLSEANASSDYVEFKDTVQLSPSNNPTDATTGYVSIVIGMSAVSPTTISSIQIIGMKGDFQDVEYEQITANRQVDHLFNYYKDPLYIKPVPSYLVGWDFGLNPAQFYGQTVTAFASGANSSNYFYDQTIVFQSANSGVTAISGNDRVQFTAAVDTKMAIVQYLDAETLASMLANNLSSNVYGYTTNVDGLPMTISLWVTTNANLPAAGSNLSVVTGLNDAGYPTVAAGWTELTRRNIGNVKASFTMREDTEPSDYGFSGWDKDFTALSTSTFFAIVVGTGTITATKTLELLSVSLVPGDIPTRPAPQTVDQVVREAQRYYEKSFALLTAPASDVGLNTGETLIIQSVADNVNQTTGTVQFATIKRAIPSLTIYNPDDTGDQLRNETQTVNCSAQTAQNASVNGFSRTFTTQVAVSAAGNTIGMHWVADSRLGIVN